MPKISLPKHRSFYLALAVLVVYVALTIVIALHPSLAGYLQGVISDNSFASAVIFIGLVIFGIVFAPVAVWPLIPVAAVLFGPFWTAVYNIIGWTIGAVIAFWFARKFGKPVLKHFVSLEKIERFEAYLPRKSHFWTMVFLRIVLPVDVLSYAVGLLSNVTYPVYIFSTFLGVSPFSFIFAYGGEAFLTGRAGVFVVAGFIGAVVFAVVLFALLKRKGYTRPMKKTIVTHSGTFHADDVFACAAILRLFGDAEIIRTREEEKIEKGDIVFDVGSEYDAGRSRFDHHQEGGAGVRANGIPYASFGLVWKHFGKEICGNDEVVAKKIDEELVAPIDAEDNGFGERRPFSGETFPYLIQDAVSSFNPTWKEKENSEGADEKFKEAVLFAGQVLDRMIFRQKHKEEARGLVEQAYNDSADKRIVILDKEYSWQDVVAEFPEPLFVIRPDISSGNWIVSAVRKTRHSFESRKKLPAEWAGKRSKELVATTGVEDAVFCHNGRFIAVAGSREGATKLAKQAIK
ncbi:MAG: MYG1 family protein [bacterium]|nr:MYG1 family protein [bacterium]